jgi:hypothetical protein
MSNFIVFTASSVSVEVQPVSHGMVLWLLFLRGILCFAKALNTMKFGIGPWTVV